MRQVFLALVARVVLVAEALLLEADPGLVAARAARPVVLKGFFGDLGEDGLRHRRLLRISLRRQHRHVLHRSALLVGLEGVRVLELHGAVECQGYGLRRSGLVLALGPGEEIPAVARRQVFAHAVGDDEMVDAQLLDLTAILAVVDTGRRVYPRFLDQELVGADFAEAAAAEGDHGVAQLHQGVAHSMS